MTSSDQIRQWSGPVLLTNGFRPFFLFGALWAALAMVVWIAMLSGALTLPTRFDPVSWHAHEFVFGYLGAVIAGFLLTAIPNWTGRLPVVGWRLAGLFGLWLAGRLAVALSALLPLGVAEAVDLLFLVVLGAVILREIVAGKNWRNLIVLVLVGVFAAANLLFHLDALGGGYAAQSPGLRLGIAAALLMIGLIGGRIVPSFTRNWLVRMGQTDLPVPPMQRFDVATLGATALALGLWVAWPGLAVTGVALIAAGVLHMVRLMRWKGYRTLAEPLVWVLHVGYLFVPLGALVEGFAILAPDMLAPGSAQHLWMAGAFGMMTLAVMARATLGHTGQVVEGGAASVAMFAAIIVAVAARLAAAVWPGLAMAFYSVSALFWVGAFLGFCALYGPSMMRPKAPRR